ncbi:MAG: 2-C-methyl-D-erythritol 2,4-cyclodiphosphate synthase [Planctomycetota bacterium]|jgi:2-C-methyl-D-erythritol 2,4-cyclodiphosphate synthase
MLKIGLGYDSHRFTSERPLMLGGVRIEGCDGLAGHSDADAVLHAITDAILGAIAAGDIGELFPDIDPQYADADSSQFIRHAMGLATQSGYRVNNCDVIVLAETPKLSEYKMQMRERIAELLEVGPECVAVKGKTNEGMGFVGEGEGIAAFAAVTLRSE